LIRQENKIGLDEIAPNRKSTSSLVCDGRTFYTDVNGTVTLHLGKPYYVNDFMGSEEYYRVYVNGQSTGHNVTSTGTGQIQSLEIDLG
jgi:hypothetical protein